LNPEIDTAQTASLPVLAKDVTWDGFYFPITFKTTSSATITTKDSIAVAWEAGTDALEMGLCVKDTLTPN